MKLNCSKILIFLIIIFYTALPLRAAENISGTEFRLMFNRAGSASSSKYLIILSAVNTSGTVEIPGLSFSQPFTVSPGVGTKVALPVDAYVTCHDCIEQKAVHITADNDVVVYGYNMATYSSDGFLGIPVSALGTEYFISTFGNFTTDPEMGVAASENNTTVTINPSVSTGSRPAGVPFNIVLNEGDAYQLYENLDLTGTHVTADKPIAVFSAHENVFVPSMTLAGSSSDHIVEQNFPAYSWGKEFITAPTGNYMINDTYRVVALSDGTAVNINGAVVATINRGKFYQTALSMPSRITTSKPAQVMQYMHSVDYGGKDPSMITVIPCEQFRNSYIVSTVNPSIGTNYINIIAPLASVGLLTLDGNPVPAGDYSAVTGSPYYYVRIYVSQGVHELSAPDPFGVYVYGNASYESYGYPGGSAVRDIRPTLTATMTATLTATETATQTATCTATASETVTMTSTAVPTATATNTPPPLMLILKGNYPNPFKYDTDIIYWLSVDAVVSVKIFTVSGEVLLEKQGINALAGYNRFYWKGKNRANKDAASGLFIYKVTACTESEKKSEMSKLVRVR
ncbi:MAG: hypothetical protein CVV21_11295 [Candidatus Goldiibacteriota bacterium HGW-Goldbacteria-1]|nr:MAG: hypothetical protein CVV21_11295 [Candidatus Goldiibacteriota bacterium HGW-Goldbacteria-1]